MKKIFSLLVLFAAVTGLSACADAGIIQPSPADAYDLDHSCFYIWDADISLQENEVLTSVSLFFNNINNWKIESYDRLFIGLLNENEMNSAVSDYNMTKAFSSNVYKAVDNAFGNALANYSELLTVFTDDNEYWHYYYGWVNPSEDFIYDFTSSEIDLLNSYIADGGSFGIGLDPDCHFYNCGISLCYEVETIPEPAAVALMFIGALFLRRRKQ